MAITKVLRRNARIEKLVQYAINPSKTGIHIYTASMNCSLSVAAFQMNRIRRRFECQKGTQAFHIIQSFSPDEITPELALQIAQEFAAEHLSEYQVVIGTHCDRKHIHNHIVFNAVSFVTGKKYHSTPQTYYGQIRAISDRLCREHGLSVIMNGEEKRKGMSYTEWKAVQNGGVSLRQVVERDVQEVLSYALDYGEFLAFMEDKGYEIKHGKYLSFRPYGYERFIRPKEQGRPLDEKAVRSIIEDELDHPHSQVLVPKPFVPYRKPMIGILGIYRHYLYILGSLSKGHVAVPQSQLFRSALRKFELYKEQHRYLVQNKITHAADIENRIQDLQNRITSLIKTRTLLNVQKKRHKKQYAALATVEHFSPVAELVLQGRMGTEEERQALLHAREVLDQTDPNELRLERNNLYQEIADINLQLREKRKELNTCRNILNTVPTLQQQLAEVKTRSDARNQPSLDYNSDSYRRPM